MLRFTTLLALALAFTSRGVTAHHLTCGDPTYECKGGETFDSLHRPTCWDTGHNLCSDWYKTAPDTNVTREYYFELASTIATPDGVEREVMAINGQIPGPTIIANWGDTIRVHLSNKLETNGTSMHFHGIHMRGHMSDDGVSSITQCPTPPGANITYRFRALQYGTTWYHSHFGLQAWNGFFGGIIIHGPASAPYDEDLGMLMISDWYHKTMDTLFSIPAHNGSAPRAPNGLINGTNVYEGGGKRFKTTFEPGKKYRLRVLNHSMDTHLRFLIDGHRFKVISADLIPIKPYETDVLNVAIGQRYDIIVEANQPVGNYWMRVHPQQHCSSKHRDPDNIKGIVQYSGAPDEEPTGPTPDIGFDCVDEELKSLVPILEWKGGKKNRTNMVNVDGERQRPHHPEDFRWEINQTAFRNEWGDPTIMQVLNGKRGDWKEEQKVIELPDKETWVCMVIVNQRNLSHPIHLHGHDFWILDQGVGTFNPNKTNLNKVTRRDTALLPTDGFLVIGFYTDNPGVWLLHCHIGWHASLGFALQLIERIEEIRGTVRERTIRENCKIWNEFARKNHIEQHESGA